MLKPALRSLAKSPVFTTVTVVSLALALALNTTLFAIVDAAVHPYVPYAHPGRVLSVMIRAGDRRHPTPRRQLARALREALSPSAERVAEWSTALTLIDGGHNSEDGRAAAVTANFFDVLGVKPEVGRSFDQSNDANRQREAVISYGVWNRLYRGAPLQGLKVTVAGATYDVVGVMPPGVGMPFGAEAWIPAEAALADSISWRFGSTVMFEWKLGIPFAQIAHELDAVSRQLAAEYGQVIPYAFMASPLGGSRAYFDGNNYMLGIVALVLVIACANLGTMMLARGLARRREMALRIALGASRRDILTLVMGDCAIIVAAGVAASLLLLLWTLHILPHMLTPSVPQLGDLRPTLSWRVFTFAVVAALGTTALAGALPGLRAAATDPAEPLKEGGTASERIRDRYNPLIIVEVALSTALLMTSGLFVLRSVQLAGFRFKYDARRLVTADLRIPLNVIKDSGAAERFYTGLMARVPNVPHVADVATSYNTAPDHGVVYAEEGRSGNHWINLSTYSVVSPGYLRTLGLAVVHGRDFAAGDAAGAGDVAIVDEEAVKRLWPDLSNPVGHMVKLGDIDRPGGWVRVVGVSRFTDFSPRRAIDLPPEPKIYIVRPGDRSRDRQLIVRGDGTGDYVGRAALMLNLRREIQAAAPWDGYPRVQPWLQQYESALSMSSFMGGTLAAFGTFGLVLCAVGLYGVLAYTVTRRLREFAIRVALGAPNAHVARIVLHDTAVTMLAGIGVGAFAGMAATIGFVDNFFSPRYEFAIALIAAEALLLATATLAAVGPLRRAVSADTVAILRAT